MNFRLSPIVKNLLIVNGLFFIAQQSFGEFMGEHFALFHFMSKQFEPHQLITSMFMHGNFMHLLGNMFALFIFGPMLEENWGGKRFLIYYMATGLGAGALHLGVKHIEYLQLVSQLDHEAVEMVYNEGYGVLASGQNYANNLLGSLNAVLNGRTIGASGAVFGILLGYGMMFPNTVIYLNFLFPIKAKYFVMIYGAFELYSGLTNHPGDNVAHFAHLGGMLFGYLLIKKWGLKQIM